MKKILFLFFCLGLIEYSVYSVTVNQKELKTDKKVKFKDYQGRYARQDSLKAIRGIGHSLARGLKQGKNPFQWYGKYSVEHVYDEKSEKYSADIFSIERRARVSSIRNVRLILAAYLQSKYQFSQEDAYTLATFITYYNAVYRRDIAYFKSRYNDQVMKKITARNAGIGLSYRQWPGRTKILIPLGKGDSSSLDTTLITDKKVVTHLKKKDDRGTSERKKIVEIKEKKLEEDKKEITRQRKEIKKKEEELKDRREQLEDKKKEAESIDDPEKKKELLEEIEREEAELVEAEKKLKKDKDELERREQEEIVKKEREIEEDKKEIKKDERIVDIKKNPERALDEIDKKKDELEQERNRLVGGRMYYLKASRWLKDGHYNNTMLMIDPATRRVLVQSPVEKIDGRQFDIIEPGIIVVVHDAETSNHNLVLLDKEKLTMVKKGQDNIFWRSFIEVRDGEIYAIVKEGQKYYLAKFDNALQLKQKSTVEIDRDTFVSFFQENIFLNRQDQQVIVLKKSDLSLVGEIEDK